MQYPPAVLRHHNMTSTGSYTSLMYTMEQVLAFRGRDAVDDVLGICDLGLDLAHGIDGEANMRIEDPGTM